MEKKSVLMDQMKKQLVSEYFSWIGSLMDLSAHPFFCKLLGLVVNPKGCGGGAQSAHRSGDCLPFLTGSC